VHPKEVAQFRAQCDRFPIQPCGARVQFLFTYRPQASFLLRPGVLPAGCMETEGSRRTGDQDPNPRDPAVVGGAVLTMALLGIAASAIPARRALAVDPSKLMREE